MEFRQIFEIFHRLWPYLFSKHGVLEFYKQATHRRLGDEPFFNLGATVHDWGWPKKGPFWTKNGQAWQACQRTKVVQKVPKWPTQVFLTIWNPFAKSLGPIWNLLDHFKQKFIFCSEAPPPNPTLSIWGKKFIWPVAIYNHMRMDSKHDCPESASVGSQMFKNT